MRCCINLLFRGLSGVLFVVTTVWLLLLWRYERHLAIRMKSIFLSISVSPLYLAVCLSTFSMFTLHSSIPFPFGVNFRQCEWYDLPNLLCSTSENPYTDMTLWSCQHLASAGEALRLISSRPRTHCFTEHTGHYKLTMTAEHGHNLCKIIIQELCSVGF